MSISARKSVLCPRKEGRVVTPEILESESEKKFVKSLQNFIEHEKRYLHCPEEGPSKPRYVLFRSVFNKLIERSSSYKRILLSIKSEYDQVIGAIGQRLEDFVRALSLQPWGSEACQGRAVRLKERISSLQKENAELQRALDRQICVRERRIWIPGLTVADSGHPELLERRSEQLRSQRAALLEARGRRVPAEVLTSLEGALRLAEQRNEGAEEHNRCLKLLYKRLRAVDECLCSWSEQEQRPPLEELLLSTLQDVTHTTVTEDELLSIDTELLEGEEPTGVDESQHLTQYLHRFVELLDSAQYKEAARHAALCPGGLLTSLHTVHMFRDGTGPPHSPPPLLLLFDSLLRSTPPGQSLPESVSFECVRCALEQGEWQLLTHAFNLDKLTCSERLGDLLAQFVLKNSSFYHSDLLLALATVNYKACGSNRNTALSMCRRGLTHSTVDFMRRCEDLQAEDHLWVLCQRPSLGLLQTLTRPERGRAMLSAGVACAALLSDPQLQEFALKLLDSLVEKGPGALEEVILEDCASTVDQWNEIASVCSAVSRSDLTQAILNVLLSQSGTQVLSSDSEGVRLTQHIFL